jgi:hypothetical protein
MNSFAITYTNKERKKLKRQFPDVESFIAGFDIETAMSEFKKYSLKEDDTIEWSEEDLAKSQKMIEGRLMALIARNLWDYSAYYQVFNPYWNTYNKAIQILQEDGYNDFNLAESKF